VCIKFDVGKATALHTVRRVTYTFYYLALCFIKWPRGEEIIRVIEEFQRTKGFQRIFKGQASLKLLVFLYKYALLNKDIPSYICRKNYLAIHLQAVCDA